MSDAAPSRDLTTIERSLPTGLLIGGAWKEAAGSARFDVVDPGTEGVIASVADATPGDALSALDAADAAASGWARTPPRARSELLTAAWSRLQERAEDIAALITLEMGKPLSESRGEVVYGGEFLRWFAEEAVRVRGDFRSAPEGSGRIVVSHLPLGPSLLITPWNFPLAMATRKIAPALAAGCTVVIKPSELAPLTTLCLGQIFQDVGLPPGVLNIVPTTHAAAVTAPMIDDPRLRKLSFTGSTAIGRRLIEQSARNVLRTSMELGGNAPFLVFEDADLEAAAQAAIVAKFRNGGEACTAANRFIVHESLSGAFAERVSELVAGMPLGHGLAPESRIGPLIDARAVDKVESLVDEAVSRGAEPTIGGHRVNGRGYFFEPTVLRDVPADSAIARAEIFGPVLAMTTFRQDEEAIRLANATEYGLACYVFTNDVNRISRLIDELQTGMMGVNAPLLSNAAAPFGGVKQSGLGREGGFEGIHEYLALKYTLLGVSD